jgi:hypothetical protein
MKNYMEQFRVTIIEDAADYVAASNSTLSGISELKVLKNKLYDTSSDADAFASLTADDVVKMSGWEDYKTENNGIFKVAEVDSGGEWVRFDMPLVDCPEDDIPSGGITLLHTPASWAVTGVSVGNAEVMAAVDMDENEAFAAEYFKVTADNIVSSFAEISGGTDVNTVAVYWADLTDG